MEGLKWQCPSCGKGNKLRATNCEYCGAPLGQEPPGQAGSSLKRGTFEVSWLMVLLVIGAVILLVFGFMSDNSITSSALFAAAAVVAILARLAQANRQHMELMDELRRRDSR